MWRPQSCPEPGGGCRSRGATWRPRSYPASGGGCRSRRDTWHPWSYTAPRGRRRSRGATWQPQRCPELGGGYHSTVPLPRLSARGQDVVVSVTPSDNPHRMITLGKTGFRVVADCLILTAASPSPIPSSARAAFVNPYWRAAMEEEYGALISNET
jgi:hypothetical protein